MAWSLLFTSSNRKIQELITIKFYRRGGYYMLHFNKTQSIRNGIRAVFAISFMMIYALIIGASGAMAGNGHPQFVADELLVQFNAGISAEKAKGLLHSHGTTTIDENTPIRVRRIKVPEQAREAVKAALAKNPNVSFVENNFIAEENAVPNDPSYTSQWHLPKISAPAGWDIETGTTDEPIAIIDSGVDPTHPDLSGKLIAGWNFLTASSDTRDLKGHGTAVAGSAAAGSNNGIGVAGVAWANPIMPLVVSSPTVSASYSNIANAITYAVDMGVRVINISLAGSSSSSTLQAAVNYAWNNGAIVFAAAANYTTSTPYYPAACDNAIAVSATTSSDTLASFSNFGNWIDIAAPGASILTTNTGGGYGSWSGTSFSSPIAAGLGALIWSVRPELTNAQVVTIMTQNADDLGTAGFDTAFGYGRINVIKSLTAALNTTPQPDTTVPTAAIIAPSANSIVSAAVAVTATATDNTAVASVELYIDNSLFETSYSEPYVFAWDTTRNTDGSHALKVVAKDLAGNQKTSTLVTVTVQNAAADTTTPVVTITSPTSGAAIGSAVIINATATDNDKVSKMEIYVDGKLMTTSTTASVSYRWNSKKASVGTHIIMVNAYDASGNKGTASVSVVKK